MGFRSCVVPESDEGESSGDECGSAAEEAASGYESESSLLEQAMRAAGEVCGPSTSAVETGDFLETGNSSDEDASHCETLGTDDSSDVLVRLRCVRLLQHLRQRHLSRCPPTRRPRRT